MLSHSPEVVERRAYRYQWYANALTELRSRAADPLATYILTTPDYRSWGVAIGLGALKATDKLDGLLAKRRIKLLASLATDDKHPHIPTNPKLIEAMRDSGKRDHLADKRLNHRIFAAVAIRDALNGDTKSAARTAAADTIMAVRDRVVNNERDHAAKRGHNGDARFLGQLKELVIDIASCALVSPLAELNPEGQDLTPGRIAVHALTYASAALSVISGVDQIHSLHQPFEQAA